MGNITFILHSNVMGAMKVPVSLTKNKKVPVSLISHTSRNVPIKFDQLAAQTFSYYSKVAQLTH